ncbi:hypothetical protein [Frigoribacterium salinisoli]
MSDPTPDRRAELLAAALADDLTPDERAELDRLRAADPTIDAELAELGGLTSTLAAAGPWLDAAPSDELRRRVAAIGADEAAPGRVHAARDARAPQEAVVAQEAAVAQEARLAPVTPLAPAAARPRPRRLLSVLAAAACLVVGAGAGALVAAPRDATVDGPPGTLGAVEPIDFEGVPAGVVLDADLVAHTWGTETVLTVDGLPPGDAFSVVVVDDEGREHESGAFLGSTVEVDCRLNAAVTREHVAAIEIRGADGEVAVAEVPRVEA